MIQKILNYVESINNFFEQAGLNIRPFPRILIDTMTQVNLSMNGGIYIPSENTIILNIGNRHIHDILRTYCHELIHREQNNEKYGRLFYNSTVLRSVGLQNIEMDAYNRGNILFEKWMNEQ